MCLRSCTVIYHELRTLFWLMFWKIVNHQKCRSKLVALQKESLLSCYCIHHTLRDSRGFSLSFKHAHDSILLTPKKTQLLIGFSHLIKRKKTIQSSCSFFAPHYFIELKCIHVTSLGMLFTSVLLDHSQSYTTPQASLFLSD